MFKIIVTVDKHQRLKSFISQTTSVRLEHSSSNAENSFVSNFKIAGYFLSSASQHSTAQLLIWNEMNSDANIAVHLSVGPLQLMVDKTSQVSLSFFASIWWITVDLLVITVVERYFRLGLKNLIPLKES